MLETFRRGGPVPRRPVILVTLAVLGLAGCTGATADTPTGASVEPATIEVVSGSDLRRLTLTEEATTRVGLATAPVGGTATDPAAPRTVPYAAVLYDPQGETWVYTNPEPLTYMRARIVVANIVSDVAILTEGPEPGTPVVTVGAAELYGTELEVGH